MYEENGNTAQFQQLSTGNSAETELSYTFAITDVEGEGSFTVTLALDLDGDGVYEVSCNAFDVFEIFQLQTDNSGALIVDGNGESIRETTADYNKLKENQYYHVRTLLPETIQGVVPWQIQVSSNDISYVSTVVESITYVPPETQWEVAVFQVYGTGEVNMESSSFYKQLLGQEAGSYYSPQLAQDVAVNITSVSVEQFNQMIGGTLQVSDLYNQYDLLILGSGDVSSNLTAEGHSFVSSYLNWGGKLLVSDTEMSLENLPFYGGSYSATGNLSSRSATSLNQLNSSKFQNYPFEISLTQENYVLNEENFYYTDIAISESEENGKIIVNTLSAIVPFAAVPEDGYTETGKVIDYWKDAAGRTSLATSTFSYATEYKVQNGAYVLDAEGNKQLCNPNGTWIEESNRRIYFSLPTLEASACLFNITGTDGTESSDLRVSRFYNQAGDEYMFGDMIYGAAMYDVYYLDIPTSELETRAEPYELALVAYADDGTGSIVPVAGNALTISFFDPSLQLDFVVDLFQQGSVDDDGNMSSAGGDDYIFLIPQG